MPQNALAANIAINPAGFYQPLKAGAGGNLYVTESATSSALNITAPTVLKAAPGVIAHVSVLVAPSTDGAVNDCAALGDVSLANQVAIIPQATGIVAVDFPCLTGIVVDPGTGGTIAVSFS